MSQTNFFNPMNNSMGKMPYPQQIQQQCLGFKGRPVSSIEEVRAIAIDYDGSIFFFPDLPNRKIYTKQINMDGTAAINMYELKEIPQEGTSNFVTREEFDKALVELQTALSSFVTQTGQSQPVTKAQQF